MRNNKDTVKTFRDKKTTESGMKHNFDDIYKHYHDYILWHILEIVKNYDIAEDICQDVWYAFYTNTQEIENVKEFLRGIARNKLYQYYEKKKKDTKLVIRLLNEETIQKNEEHYNKFLEFADLITAEITDEQEREREKLIVIMKELHSYSHAEIGRRLGLSERQVEDRVRKTTIRITEYIQKNGIETIKELIG